VAGPPGLPFDLGSSASSPQDNTRSAHRRSEAQRSESESESESEARERLELGMMDPNLGHEDAISYRMEMRRERAAPNLSFDL
jgi:hypothetical protein